MVVVAAAWPYLITQLKKAGYPNPRVVTVSSGSEIQEEVQVDEDIRDEKGWPLLWSICEKEGVRYGNGGTKYCGGRFPLSYPSDSP